MPQVRVALLVASLLYVCESSACECPPRPSLEDAFRQSALVFEGTVVAIQDRDSGFRSVRSWFAERFAGKVETNVESVGVEVELRVTDSWKGQSGVQSSVLTHKSTATCGFPFKVGAQYLVFASDRTNPPVVSLCSRTAPVTSAQEDLSVLKHDSASRSNKTMEPTR
jgi:hypothetical protein